MRRTAVLLTTLLAATACGSSALETDPPEEDVTTTVAIGTTTTTTPRATTLAPATSAVVFDPEAWVKEVAAARQEFFTAIEPASNAYLDALLAGAGTDTAAGLVASGDFSRASIAAFSAMRDDLPQPQDDALGAALDSYLDSVDDVIGARETFLAAIDADATALATEFDAAGADLDLQEATQLAMLNAAIGVAEEAEQGACFLLSDAIAEAGLTGFACTPEPSAAEDIDPTTAPTDPFGSGIELEPGFYDFTVFERPFSIELTKPVEVRTAPDSLRFASPDNSELTFQVLAVDSIVDPADVAEQTLPAEIDAPSDLTAWIAALPVDVNASGVATLGNQTFDWWDVFPQGSAGFAWFALDQFPSSLQFLDLGDTRIWHRPTPSGPVMVYAQTVLFSGIPHEDQIAFVESTLAGAAFE